MKFRARQLALGNVRAMKEIKKELLYLTSARRPRKILFDHLPKCGGSSLNAYLGAHYPIRKTFWINVRSPAASVDEFKRFPESRRYGYDLINGHLAGLLIDFAHPECLKVTMLRDPVDRIISHYYYVKRSPTHYLYSKVHESDMSLKDYVTSGLSRELGNWYTTHFSGLGIEDVEQYPEDSIKRAVDIIGFLDGYSSFTQELRDRARLRYEYQDRKLNVTSRRVSINDVPQSTIDAIEQMNQLDIVLYRRIRDAVG